MRRFGRNSFTEVYFADCNPSFVETSERLNGMIVKNLHRRILQRKQAAVRQICSRRLGSRRGPGSI